MSVVKVDGVEVHVPPGEAVVVNGVRVEVHGASGGKSPRAAVPLLITGPQPKRQAARGRSPKDLSETKAILDALTEHGPLDAAHLLDALGTTTKDPRRKVLGQRIYRMVQAKTLRPIKADRHIGQPRYEVVPVPA